MGKIVFGGVVITIPTGIAKGKEERLLATRFRGQKTNVPCITNTDDSDCV